jgi:protoheme IX farnesyltransferase
MGDVARWVEASHRISTSFSGVLAIILFFWALKAFPAGSSVRKGAALALTLTLLEGLIGAILVKFQLVTTNASPERLAVSSFHVISTYFLLGSIAYTALMAQGFEKPDLKKQGSALTLLVVGFVSVMFMGISGSISAMGHQLKPVDNVIAAAMSPATDWMVRVQPLHPLLGVTVGVYLLLLGGLITHLRPSPFVKKGARWLVGLYALQMVVGALNVIFKAPIPMQMFHLTMADVNFVTLVALSCFALAPSVQRLEVVSPEDPTVGGFEPMTPKQKIGAYLVLTKPRVISLLLFTTMTALFSAAGGWPGAGLFFACLIGGYMAAGAANAINMVIDRDIDGTMKRTSKRPTVTQSISSTNALLFAFTLAAGSFTILWLGANLLCAMLSLAGLAFYVVVYTLMLKRRTWHNIVIGGAAGAFPPLVGWTAYTGQLTPLAWILFAIIFVWTPVHFWALALMIKDDYAKANVPMLPVVHGERATVTQIVLYAIVTAIVSVLPVFFPPADGPRVAQTYLVIALGLNVVLLIQCVQLFMRTDRPHALKLYKFSMVYLAVLFLVFAIDCAIPKGSAKTSSVAPISAPVSSTRTSCRQGRVFEVRQGAPVPRTESV